MELHNWKFESHNQYLYCVGALDNGKRWETSYIISVETKYDHYRVTTANSVYYLFW